MQLICYGEGGQPLFPVQQVRHVDLKGTSSDESFQFETESGLHGWVRASACIAIERSVDELKQASSPPPPKVDAPAPKKAEVDAGPKASDAGPK